MQPDEIKDLFRSINVWSRGSERAPHKPLLVLYALGQWQHGNREISFEEAEEPLRELLEEFGPPRKSHHPEYPFWYLQNDGLWTLQNAEDLKRRASSNAPTRAAMRQNDVVGSFPENIVKTFDNNERLVYELAHELLDAHFQETMHADILEAVGLRFRYVYEDLSRRVRDPRFRFRVLVAYEHRCAVCGFDVRLGNTLVAVEAAHIQWHQAGGPDEPFNGLALCSLHHKLFDRGAFTISREGTLQVSQHAHGSSGLEEYLLRYHGDIVRSPVHPDYTPQPVYIDWHHREVFRGPAR